MNRAIPVMLVPVLGCLASCGNKNGHVDSWHVVILRDTGYSEYNYGVEKPGTKLLRLRCEHEEKDFYCSDQVLNGCQDTFGAEYQGGIHRGSHRVYWPQWQAKPVAPTGSANDWMWIVECRTR